MSVFYFLILLPILSFSFTTPYNEIANLSNYSYPRPIYSDSLEKIAIVATNDIHGHILPTVNRYPGAKKDLKTGGLNLLSSYIKAVHSEWGEKMLWLDGGDQFQGTLESNYFVGETVVKSFNYMNYTGKFVSAVGNHDYDFNYENMSYVFNQADYPYVSANVYNKSTGEYWNFTDISPSKMVKIGDLNIGIIGLTTIQTPWTSAFNVNELDFREYVNITIRESASLKARGADIVLLVCHVGMFCSDGDPNDLMKLTMRKKSTVQKTSCSEEEELYQFLHKLPKGVVDSVVGGHSHTIVHHWINEIPVVINHSYARHFNIIYLTYDKIKKKLITEATEMEGPVPICEALLPNERTCFPEYTPSGEFKNNNGGVFTNFTFHNREIKEDLGLYFHLKSYIDLVDHTQNDIVAYIEQPMDASRSYECSMGNFVADAVKDFTKSDMSIINRGVLRRNWLAGNLSYYTLFETIPFENLIVTFETNGRNLTEIMKITQGGDLGFYITAGLRQVVCADPHYLLDLKLQDDFEIDPEKIYTVATTDFMAFGGDDFHDVVKYYPLRNIKKYGRLRDLVEIYLRKEKRINKRENPCVDRKLPRLIVKSLCIVHPTESIMWMKD